MSGSDMSWLKVMTCGLADGGLYVKWLRLLSAVESLNRSCRHSRLVGSSGINHDVVVELFEVGGADHSEAGLPPLGVMPFFNPLNPVRGELDPAGPGLSVKKFCLHG